ncbi:sugar ABC transporter permease [Clostridium thermosuccinogenes]|uniref:Sugar ABC transporter permease n=1 Tax=Clostridium thermosuccinogenes TaxID=84032 RepID=A0A2K2EWT5_9CLOT|nr:carbohydrate ABC transporter permease [Pseudoclostridium thermosuccinogenes]AUS98381.1 sugar ABC transporter permease [Pseudoclostridium thermosuccinogenes]PNT90969.1 sugar ABC transporter permease [Pseudoclostridium thermosuccinogenes]PNT98939.1 sugar ABC transporter permease [Pseudoclostridium thermosuccinogenes]PNU00854.1 sugar ABC transporter permease [Pseudoclostridium thermosuccinogenes]
MERTTSRANQFNGKIIIYVLLFLGSVIMIFPFIWMIFTSLKTVPETMKIPPTFFPDDWKNIKAYNNALNSLPFLKLYLNTGLLIFFRVICAIVTSSMAAYAFAKIDFPGKKFLFTIVLTQLMLPSQIYMIPQYQMIIRLNAANTIFALVFPGLVSAFGVFFLRQTYMGIPDSLIDSAIIDGCNQFQAFYKIALPLTQTAISALTIFTALFAYSDLMWPLIVNTDKNMLTLSSGLSTLKGQYTTNYPNLMAGSALAMWPMIVIYLIFQKRFIQGIALTGTKA